MSLRVVWIVYQGQAVFLKVSHPCFVASGLTEAMYILGWLPVYLGCHFSAECARRLRDVWGPPINVLMVRFWNFRSYKPHISTLTQIVDDYKFHPRGCYPFRFLWLTCYALFLFQFKGILSAKAHMGGETTAKFLPVSFMCSCFSS